MATPWMPCRVGCTIAEIDTPALVLDLDRMEKNLMTMTEKMKAYPGVAIRAHGKAHKCPAFSQIQIENGAVGMCCQTLTEAEAFVNGGIKDVVLTNQIIGKRKLRRLVSLSKRAKVAVIADSQGNVHDIDAVAAEFGVKMPVVVEVCVGGRCGVRPGEPVADLAKLITSLPNLTFQGLHCYNGYNQHVRQAEERRKNVQVVVEQVQKSLQALSSQGIECNYITGGGTGSFQFEAESGVFTEVQPGSYVLMDVDYSKNLNLEGNLVNDFSQSLFVLSTVQSVTPGEKAIVDCGMKGVSLDSGVPLVYGDEGTLYISGGDEHGGLVPDGGRKVGDLVWLIPGHCDPTVNLYDWLIGMRNGRVETIWPITGRGPGV